MDRELLMAEKPSYEELERRVRQLEQESAEHGHAKVALQESEAKYRAMVESFDGLIYVCSQDYRVEFMNDRCIERTGYNAVGEFCYRALHGRDSICPWCVNERVLQGETVRWEVQSPKDNRWYYIVNTPIYRIHGKISKQAMILDITDRKRVEQLLDAEREILAMVATGRPLQKTLDALNLMIERLAPGTLCSILMLDKEGKRLFHQSAPSLPREYVKMMNGLEICPNTLARGSLPHNGATVMAQSTATDLLCTDGGDSAARFGLGACWSLPIQDSTGKTLGTFALYDRERRQTSFADIELVEIAAHLAGLAIDRERSERARSESEEKYHSLFEHSADAICFTTREGRFIDVNQSTVDLLGYDKSEMLNTITVADTYANPEDRVRFQKEIEKQGSVKNFEVKFRRKDGRELDCLLTSSVRFSDEGTVLGYQSIIRDITEIKRAEKAILENEARYRAVVEDQTELICRFLPGGTITFVNQAYCRYFGKRREQLVGQSFMLFIPTSERAKVEEHLASLSLDNPVATHEHQVIAPDGEIRWQQWTNRIIADEQGSVTELQAVGRDTTEQRLMAEALQQSAEKTKLFAYSVSHDLKSPAIGIYGLSKLLYRQYRDILDEKGRSYCDQILKTAEQIAALVEHINHYIATKQVPINIETVKVKEILQMVKDEFSTRLNIHKITWLEPEEVPAIRADRLALVRVLRNLVDNALKYGGDDLSEIRIGYRDAGKTHVLSVSDNGVGIGMADSNRIFERFERDATARGIEGTGLGLAIVKEIAEQHGGKVWMESEPERGTTFCLSIAKDL
jgi:PAS domain S-box-containing protein